MRISLILSSPHLLLWPVLLCQQRNGYQGVTVENPFLVLAIHVAFQDLANFLKALDDAWFPCGLFMLPEGFQGTHCSQHRLCCLLVVESSVL